jgi:positive regulator of sigma E activity
MKLEVFQGEVLETRRDVVAYSVSLVLHPVFSFPAGLVSFLFFKHGFNEVLWAFTSIVVALIPILVLIQYKRRFKDNVTLDKNQRRSIYLVGVLSLGSTYLAHLILDAPIVLQNIGLSALLTGLLSSLINLKTKISVHEGSIAGAAALNFFTPLFPVYAFCCIMTGWSRLHLDRHTLWQVFAGLAAGTVFGVIVLGMPS